MGRAKALLPFRDGTFLSVLAGTLGAFCSPVIAVFGFDGERVSQSAPASVTAVVNHEYQLGMLTSLQTGLRALGSLPARVLFTLVDHPAVSRATVLGCSQAARKSRFPASTASAAIPWS